MHEDCCCTPPCIPCLNPLYFCYPDPCGGCLSIDNYTFEITDSEDNPTYPDCAFCDLFNGLYSVDIDNDTATFSNTWFVRTGFCSPTNFGQRSLRVDSYLGFTATQIDFTEGVLSNGDIGLPVVGQMYPCADDSIPPGHYIIVSLYEFFNFGLRLRPGLPAQRWNGFRSLYFLQTFSNADVLENCDTDQTYGLCSGLSGGTMRLLGVYAQAGCVFGAGCDVTYSTCDEITDYPFCTIPSVNLNSVTIQISSCGTPPL